MKFLACTGATAALAVFGAGAALAQVTITGEGAEMADLKACIAQADDGDTSAIDACVASNIDEIEAFIAAHPKTEAADHVAEGRGVETGDEMNSEEASEESE
ncbi:MAG: hypothetical protein WA989_03390 [Henriciella sp.]|uniref:hypothetical protein n=1 Tax=Henriciella sp. TaxID=1968823 RepID=UPI003C72F785